MNSKEEKELFVKPELILEELAKAKKEGYTFLADITGVDFKEYFEVIYQLYSYEDNKQRTLKVKLNREKPEMNSATSLWNTANWLEREVFDMLGIIFIDHPNLERILTWEGFSGYPLRKDFINEIK